MPQHPFHMQLAPGARYADIGAVPVLAPGVAQRHRHDLHDIVRHYGLDAVRTRIDELHAAGCHAAADTIAAELRALSPTTDTGRS